MPFDFLGGAFDIGEASTAFNAAEQAGLDSVSRAPSLGPAPPSQFQSRPLLPVAAHRSPAPDSSVCPQACSHGPSDPGS